jgi:hypothetical protein
MSDTPITGAFDENVSIAMREIIISLRLTQTSAGNLNVT